MSVEEVEKKTKSAPFRVHLFASTLLPALWPQRPRPYESSTEMRLAGNREDIARSDSIHARDVRRTPGRPPPRWPDVFVKALSSHPSIDEDPLLPSSATP